MNKLIRRININGNVYDISNAQEPKIDTKYYNSLSQAINDINNDSYQNAVSYSEEVKVRV